MCISSILQDVYMITMHSVDYYSNIPHCGSLPRVVVVVAYKEMSVATVAHKHHKSYFTAKKESYLAAQGY